MKEDSVYFWIGVGTGLIGALAGIIVCKLWGIL